MKLLRVKKSTLTSFSNSCDNTAHREVSIMNSKPNFCVQRIIKDFKKSHFQTYHLEFKLYNVPVRRICLQEMWAILNEGLSKAILRERSPQIRYCLQIKPCIS